MNIQNSNRRSRVWYISLNIASFILVLTSLLLITAAVYPFDVMHVDSPLKVVKPVVPLDEYIVYAKLKYNKKVDTPTFLEGQLVINPEKKDIVIIALPLMGWNLPCGNNEVIVGFPIPAHFNLPSAVDSVKAKIILTSRYEIMGFRNVDIKYETEIFTIKINGKSG